MSFEWKGATIRARELTIADDDAILRLIVKLPDGSIANSGRPFAEFVVGARVDGAAPVPQVTALDAADAVQASYTVWLTLPRKFMRLWQAELDAAEADVPNG